MGKKSKRCSTTEQVSKNTISKDKNNYSSQNKTVKLDNKSTKAQSIDKSKSSDFKNEKTSLKSQSFNESKDVSEKRLCVSKSQELVDDKKIMHNFNLVNNETKNNTCNVGECGSINICGELVFGQTVWKYCKDCLENGNLKKYIFEYIGKNEVIPMYWLEHNRTLKFVHDKLNIKCEGKITWTSILNDEFQQRRLCYIPFFKDYMLPLSWKCSEQEDSEYSDRLVSLTKLFTLNTLHKELTNCTNLFNSDIIKFSYNDLPDFVKVKIESAQSMAITAAKNSFKW